MKRLYFDKLTVVSHHEKAARVLPFHRKATILKGENDVGKSSLMKTLMKTFGTEPHKETPQWTDAVVQSLVDFNVDDTPYRLLRSKGTFGLFDGNDKLIKAFTSVTSGLGPALAELFNFHLTLETKGAGPTQATPAFLFLPFYADQDRSWVSSLDGFVRLTQFQRYRRDVLSFHTGIQPNEYYQAKANKMEAEKRQLEEQHSRDVVMFAIRKVERLFIDNDFALSVDDFKVEVEELLTQSATLVAKEAELKAKLVDLRNLQIAIDSQLTIVFRAAEELGEDFNYAALQLNDDVPCPTCGAHYENSIAERFAIAVDENQCRELMETLQDERKRVQTEYDAASAEMLQISANSKQIDQLLASRKSDVNLREVLQSEGKREVRKALYKDADELNKRIGEIDDEIKTAQKEMKSFTKAARTRTIKESYREKMNQYLNELGVQTKEGQYDDIYCTIKESGSDGPRALLAYQFAILHTISQNSSSTFCPIVIDSPKQQDQDEKNWSKMREFIRERIPANAQLILGLVDDGDTDFGGSVHTFDKKRKVMQRNAYEEAASRLNSMFDAIVAFREEND